MKWAHYEDWVSVSKLQFDHGKWDQKKNTYNIVQCYPNLLALYLSVIHAIDIIMWHIVQSQAFIFDLYKTICSFELQHLLGCPRWPCSALFFEGWGGLRVSSQVETFDIFWPFI